MKKIIRILLASAIVFAAVILTGCTEAGKDLERTLSDYRYSVDHDHVGG